MVIDKAFEHVITHVKPQLLPDGDVTAIRAWHIRMRQGSLKYCEGDGTHVLLVDASQTVQARFPAVVGHCISHYRRESLAIKRSGANPHLRLLFYLQSPALMAFIRPAIFCESALERQDASGTSTLSETLNMHIQLDLNHNDRDALLRHCREFVPSSGDAREDSRLADALETLAVALEQALLMKHE
ncbi:hypothetical protein [Pseudomonas sp. NBRC 111119]|uniref:hypothetical protein n=2 Tax=unclassified Pseudomonas TaxID=196821 RepID=UPI00076127B4|nr:hypothetical protein [Pseudomonas sp. NBRC 111119]